MANTEVGWQFCALEQALSQIQTTQAEILGRLDRIEKAQAQASARSEDIQTQSSDQHERQTAHTNYMVNALNAKVAGLNLQEHTLAKDRAFAITEVLENVFVQLPMRDLLFAQGVNKRFASVIQTSTKLQRAMFFLPEPLGEKPRSNPLMSDAKFFDRLKLFYKKRGTNERSFEYQASMTVKNGIHLPEELCKRADASTLTSAEICQRGNGAYEVLLTRKTRPLERRSQQQVEMRRLSGDAADVGSWKRMYICQPPCPVAWQTSGVFGQREEHVDSGLGPFLSLFGGKGDVKGQVGSE